MTSPNIPNVQAEERRYADIQTLQQLDESTLDPEMHYRWVHESPLRVARHRMKGYQPVMRDSGVNTLAGYLDDSADGIIRLGDTILMACPNGTFLARKKEQRKTAASRLSAPAKQFRKHAKKARVRTLREEEE